MDTAFLVDVDKSLGLFGSVIVAADPLLGHGLLLGGISDFVNEVTMSFTTELHFWVALFMVVWVGLGNEIREFLRELI